MAKTGKGCHDQLVRFSLEALANLRHFHPRLDVGLHIPAVKNKLWGKRALDSAVETWNLLSSLLTCRADKKEKPVKSQHKNTPPG